MAREFGRIRISIASDHDIEELSADAQWLYFRVLIPDPTLSYAGVADWRPKRLVTKARDMTLDRLTAAAAELEERRYALFDTDTEEVLVRTLIRGDELLKNPKMAAAVVKAYGAVASRSLRAAIVTEVQREHAERPDFSSWTHKDTKTDLARLLTRPNLDAVGYSNQIETAITDTSQVHDGDTRSVQNTNRKPVGNANRITNPDPSSDTQSKSVPIHSNSNIQHTTATSGGYVTAEGHQGPANEPPPRTCPRHPDGTTERCAACGDARRAREAYDQAQADADAEQRRRRRTAINACAWCDDAGIRHEPNEVRDHDLPAIRCDHTPMAVDDWMKLLAPQPERAHA